MLRPVRKQAGFTLIELIVVLAIIGVLIAFLLPAIQATRSAAMRTQCQSKLRQIVLASHHYHESAGTFPSGVRYRGGRDPMRLSTWLAALLPYLDQSQLWADTQAAYRVSRSPFNDPPHRGLGTPIQAFQCPADYRVATIQRSLVSNRQVAFTSYLGVSGRSTVVRDGLFYPDSRIRLQDITDGASNTLFAGERPPSANFQYGWWYAGAGQGFTGSGDALLGVNEPNLLVVTVGSCAPGTYSFAPGSFTHQCDFLHFWSPHSGGGHFAFADGSVRFFVYSAEPLLKQFASRAGGEVVTE